MLIGFYESVWMLTRQEHPAGKRGEQIGTACLDRRGTLSVSWDRGCVQSSAHTEHGVEDLLNAHLLSRKLAVEVAVLVGRHGKRPHTYLRNGVGDLATRMDFEVGVLCCPQQYERSRAARVVKAILILSQYAK